MESNQSLSTVQAVHVKKTWGSHCDKLIFMSTADDEELGAVELPGAEEGRHKLWGKTKGSGHLYDHFLKNDFF